MLNKIRDGASSWMSKVLVWGVALSFVGGAFFIWGTVDQKGEAVAIVDGEEIGPDALRRTIGVIEQNMRAQFGGQMDASLLKALNLPQMAADSLISRALQKRAAREAGLSVSDEELTAAIHKQESFQVNGSFDNRRYFDALQLNGFTPARFENGLREDLLVEKLRTAIVRTAIITDAEVRSRYLFDNQKVTAAYATLSATTIGGKLTPEKETLVHYYDTNGSEFMTPEIRSFRALTIDNDSFSDTVTVTDEKLEDYYSRHIDEYVQKEGVEASHILFTLGSGATEKEKTEALEKVTAAYKRLEGGEAFAALAKELSEGPSAAKGGSLGSFSRGQMVPEFDDVAFSLDVGAYSKPFLTPFGWHIVKVTAKHQGSIPALDAVRDEIADGVRREGAKTLARRFTEELAKSATAENFAALTDKYPNVKVNSYSATQGNSNFAADALQNLEKLVFELEAQKVSAPQEIAEGFALVMVDSVTAPSTPPLRKVRKKVLAAWRKDEGTRIAEETANRIADSVKGGVSLADAAKEEGAAVTLSQPFSRAKPLDGSPAFPEALDMATEDALVVPRGSDFYVVTLVERLPVDFASLAPELTQLRGRLKAQKESALYNEFLASVQAEAEANGVIERNFKVN